MSQMRQDIGGLEVHRCEKAKRPKGCEDAKRALVVMYICKTRVLREHCSEP